MRHGLDLLLHGFRCDENLSLTTIDILCHAKSTVSVIRASSVQWEDGRSVPLVAQ